MINIIYCLQKLIKTRISLLKTWLIWLEGINPLMHNVPKWSDTHAARFLKYEWPLWDIIYERLNIFFYKKWVHFIVYQTFHVFTKIGRNETGWLFLTFCFSSCLWIGTILAVSHSVGKIPGRKMKYRGLHSPLWQIWNVWMLIRSNPYALLGFNFIITVNSLDTNPIKWTNTLK